MRFRIVVSGVARAALLLATLAMGVQQLWADSFKVDQQNLANGLTNSLIFSGAGQSFTPGLTQIDDATFVFAANSVTLQMSVYQGTGIGGTLLGTSGTVLLSGGSFQTVEFDLTAPITLTAGASYTLFVRALSGSFGQEFSNANPYSGGVAFDEGGNPSSVTDLVFSEGPHAVPEPATLSLLAAGMLGLLGIRRKSKS